MIFNFLCSIQVKREKKIEKRKTAIFGEKANFPRSTSFTHQHRSKVGKVMGEVSCKAEDYDSQLVVAYVKAMTACYTSYCKTHTVYTRG